MNEVEGEVKSKAIASATAAEEGGGAGGGGGGGVRVSDRVLEMELGVVWEADRKWSYGVDLSEGTKVVREEFKVVSFFASIRFLFFSLLFSLSLSFLPSISRRISSAKAFADLPPSLPSFLPFLAFGLFLL